MLTVRRLATGIAVLALLSACVPEPGTPPRPPAITATPLAPPPLVVDGASGVDPIVAAASTSALTIGTDDLRLTTADGTITVAYTDSRPEVIAVLSAAFGTEPARSELSGASADDALEVLSWPGFELSHSARPDPVSAFRVRVTSDSVGLVAVSTSAGLSVGDRAAARLDELPEASTGDSLSVAARPATPAELDAAGARVGWVATTLITESDRVAVIVAPSGLFGG